jgi:nucleoside-diphosphate-sugar epimerase
MQVLITGAGGRLARLLRAVWSDRGPSGFHPLWSVRRATSGPDVVWDIASGPAPQLAKGFAILHLAGVVRGDSVALSGNSAMARAVCAAAKTAGASHVFLASSAAVYGRALHDHVEVQAPAPVSDYGQAKLAMERAALCWAHGAGPAMPGVTCLRIGNVLGADALFGGAQLGHTVLDPLPGQPGGPVRSYIGPQALAGVLAGLVAQVRAGAALPKLLNIAAPGVVSMADLLDAAQRRYSFGKSNPDVIPRVGLCTKRLSALVPLGKTDASALVADWQGVVMATA